MKITDKKTYLLIYDNNLSYEDHHTTPLCSVATKKKAEKFAEWCNNWIKNVVANKPERPIMAMSDSDYDEMDKKCTEYHHGLTPVFPELKENVEYNDGGRVYVVEVAMAK